jgi:hypothetical protein
MCRRDNQATSYRVQKTEDSWVVRVSHVLRCLNSICLAGFNAVAADVSHGYHLITRMTEEDGRKLLTEKPK